MFFWFFMGGFSGYLLELVNGSPGLRFSKGSKKREQLARVQIQASLAARAAMRNCSVVTWRSSDAGGNSRQVQER